MKFFAEKRKLRGPYVLDIFIALLVIYVLVQVIFHDMVAFHEWTMSYLVPGSAFFFAKNLVTKGKQVRILLWALLVLLFYYGVTSVAEKYQIHALIWPKYIIWEDAFRGRSDGPFKHAAVFGTIIGMMLPINLYFIATVRSVHLKAALFANLALGMAGLFFTYTRGSWLAGAAALLVVVVLNKRQYLRLVLPALVIVPMLAIGVLGFGEDKMMKERFENEDTLGSRIGTMVTATKVWRDNPFFGVGFYQYRFVMGDYIEPVEAPGLGTIRVSQFRYNPPHDIFIAYLAEQGLIWVFLQGGIYFLVFRTFVRHYKNRKPEDEFTNRVMPIFAGVFVGYLVGGLAFDYKFFSVVGAWFYMFAGILYGYRPEDYYGTEAPAVAEPTRPSLRIFPRSWTKRSPQVE
jgi:O-antigen ligase